MFSIHDSREWQSLCLTNFILPLLGPVLVIILRVINILKGDREIEVIVLYHFTVSKLCIDKLIFAIVSIVTKLFRGKSWLSLLMTTAKQ